MKTQPYDALIQKLLDCALACEACATACLNHGHATMMKRCLFLNRDCADICTLAAWLLQRQSEISKQFLLVCEEICRMCADECAQHDFDHCQACAETCRSCAEACHQQHEPITQS